jgi:hypothetical protein
LRSYSFDLKILKERATVDLLNLDIFGIYLPMFDVNVKPLINKISLKKSK